MKRGVDRVCTRACECVLCVRSRDSGHPVKYPCAVICMPRDRTDKRRSRVRDVEWESRVIRDYHHRVAAYGWIHLFGDFLRFLPSFSRHAIVQLSPTDLLKGEASRREALRRFRDSSVTWAVCHSSSSYFSASLFSSTSSLSSKGRFTRVYTVGSSLPPSHHPAELQL